MNLTDITLDQRTEALRYIHKIRNHNKRAYAICFYEHAFGRGPQPKRDDHGLSMMGAQAVQIRLLEILGGCQ